MLQALLDLKVQLSNFIEMNPHLTAAELLPLLESQVEGCTAVERYCITETSPHEYKISLLAAVPSVTPTSLSFILLPKTETVTREQLFKNRLKEGKGWDD